MRVVMSFVMVFMVGCMTSPNSFDNEEVFNCSQHNFSHTLKGGQRLNILFDDESTRKEIKIVDASTPLLAIENQLETIDEHGQVLSSKGMLNINISAPFKEIRLSCETGSHCDMQPYLSQNSKYWYPQDDKWSLIVKSADVEISEGDSVYNPYNSLFGQLEPLRSNLNSSLTKKMPHFSEDIYYEMVRLEMVPTEDGGYSLANTSLLTSEFANWLVESLSSFHLNLDKSVLEDHNLILYIMCVPYSSQEFQEISYMTYSNEWELREAQTMFMKSIQEHGVIFRSSGWINLDKPCNVAPTYQSLELSADLLYLYSNEYGILLKCNKKGDKWDIPIFSDEICLIADKNNLQTYWEGSAIELDVNIAFSQNPPLQLHGWN